MYEIEGCNVKSLHYYQVINLGHNEGDDEYSLNKIRDSSLACTTMCNNTDIARPSHIRHDMGIFGSRMEYVYC